MTKRGGSIDPQVNPGTTPGATPGVSWGSRVENFSCRCRGTTRTPQNTHRAPRMGRALGAGRKRAAQLIPARRSPQATHGTYRGESCTRSRGHLFETRFAGKNRPRPVRWVHSGLGVGSVGQSWGQKPCWCGALARHPKTVGERGGFRGLGVRGPLGDQARPHRGGQGLLVPKTSPWVSSGVDHALIGGQSGV